MRRAGAARLWGMSRAVKSTAMVFGVVVEMLAGAMLLGCGVGAAVALVVSEIAPAHSSALDRDVELGDLHLPLYEFRTVAAGGEEGDRLLPDPRLTPGETVDVDLTRMCEIGYAASVRDVAYDLRNYVFEEYGLRGVDRRHYEVDHLLPLSIGGSNGVRNVWPESRLTEPWNAAVKDTLEDVLHREVCAGQFSREEAQEAIRSDWIAAYHKYVGDVPRRFVPHDRGAW